MVLISMGGVDLRLPFIDQLAALPDTLFVLAGQQQTAIQGDNILLLARQSPFYHPDLINGSDLVVCKSGYSTVAECYQAGVTPLTVGRATFPESPVLEHFAKHALGGHTLDQETFLSGGWLNTLPRFCSHRKTPPPQANGAEKVAAFLLPRIS